MAGDPVIGRAYKLGKGFKGLAAYLEHGHADRSNPDRVDWIESRNLPTRDPEAAARIMAATARDSERVEKPVYHLSISFDPSDPVNRETMRRVADRTLRDLGLQEHQVLIVAHRDTEHPHMHLMVNTVHPERHRAWSNSCDFRRIEETLRKQEADLGLRIVPGKHAPVPEHARARVDRAPARPVRGDARFLERVRAEAGPHLTGARSWGELERGLAEHGLVLRIKGPGMVVTDGTYEVKASEVDTAASRSRLERRLGSYTNRRAREAIAGRTLDARAAQQRGPEVIPAGMTDTAPAAIPAGITRPPAPRAPQVERAPAPPAPRAHHTEPAPAAPVIPVAPADRPAPAPAARTRPPTYREAARDFARESRALYADPAAARRAFLSAAHRRGADLAAVTLRDEPHRFGALRPGADPARSARAADAAFDYARHHARRTRPALKQAAALLREADAYQRAEQAVHAVTAEAARALTEPARMAESRRAALNAARAFRDAAADVYTDPARAVREIAKYRALHGVSETVRAIREAPAHFGALHAVESTRYLGFVRVTSYEAAYNRAKGLAETFRAAATARNARPRAGDVHRAAQRARSQRRALDAASAALRPVNVPGNVREAASRLLAAQIGGGPEMAAQLATRLAPMLPASAAQLARNAFQIGKELARGHDRERDRGLSL